MYNIYDAPFILLNITEQVGLNLQSEGLTGESLWGF